jgi:hypothetical protein
MAMFYNPSERLNAEVTLRQGAHKGSYTANGYALIVDRLDQILAILRANAEVKK